MNRLIKLILTPKDNNKLQMNWEAPMINQETTLNYTMKILIYEEFIETLL